MFLFLFLNKFLKGGGRTVLPRWVFARGVLPPLTPAGRDNPSPIRQGLE